MVWFIKCLPHKHNDLNWIHGTHVFSSQTTRRQVQANERPCLKKKGQQTLRKDIQSWPLTFMNSWMHRHIHEHSHTHHTISAFKLQHLANDSNWPGLSQKCTSKSVNCRGRDKQNNPYNSYRPQAEVGHSCPLKRTLSKSSAARCTITLYTNLYR